MTTRRRLSHLNSNADIETQAHQDALENSPRAVGCIDGPLRPQIRTVNGDLEAKLAKEGINVQLLSASSGSRKLTVVAKDYSEYLIAREILVKRGFQAEYKKFEIIKG